LAELALDEGVHLVVRALLMVQTQVLWVILRCLRLDRRWQVERCWCAYRLRLMACLNCGAVHRSWEETMSLH